MLEQMYQDFTTKLLPKIAEGIIVTKDYFSDLFGRYIHYLIITDTFCAVLGFLILVVTVCFFVGYMKWAKKKNDEASEWNKRDSFSPALFFLIPLIIGLIMFFYYLDCLIKDIYIPEVRIIEEIKNFNNK